MNDGEYWMRADEFNADLEKDIEFQRRKGEREKRRAEREAKLDSNFKLIMMDLRKLGVNAASIEEMTRQYAPLPSHVIEALLEWLPKTHHDRINESIVRALGAAQSPFDGNALVQCYEASNDEGLRFAILNTIALARPHSIDDWLQKMREDPTIRKKLGVLGKTERK